MQRAAVTPALTTVAFDFFYWFSRFKAALKENEYLRKDTRRGHGRAWLGLEALSLNVRAHQTARQSCCCPQLTRCAAARELNGR
jgi:hypothetical protein